jgi:hypothetical protein
MASKRAAISNQGLPDRLLRYEFGEPPTLGGFLAQEIFEISHRTSRRLCRCVTSL